MPPVDIIATRHHYADHMRGVWECLPDGMRGVVYGGEAAASGLAGPVGALRDAGRDPSRFVLVSGQPDLARLRHRTGIFMEHGCGQSYGGSKRDRVAERHPAHPGGRARDKAAVFLAPNRYAADRDAAAYPKARVEVIGSPRLAALQSIPHEPTDPPTVCVSTHWHAQLCRESGSAWGAFHDGFADLARSGTYRVIGHAHPRIFRSLVKPYRAMGIEPVASFEEVLRRASVYVIDNSSSLYEWAALRGPTVVLDAPWWRTDVEHGLRFWDAADVGPRIGDAAGLSVAVESALRNDPWPGAEEILERVFPPVEDPAGRAADIIADVVLGAPLPARRP